MDKEKQKWPPDWAGKIFYGLWISTMILGVVGLYHLGLCTFIDIFIWLLVMRIVYGSQTDDG